MDFDQLCKQFWVHERSENGTFLEMTLESARTDTLELNFCNKSCRGGSEDHFGAKLL